MVKRQRPKNTIGKLLIHQGVITQKQLKEALALQGTLAKKGKERFLGEILLEQGYVKPEDLNRALAFQKGFPYIDIRNYKIDPEIIALIPKEMAIRYNFIPVDQIGDVLTVAMLNPLDEMSKEGIERFTDLKVKAFLILPSELEQMFRQYYG